MTDLKYAHYTNNRSDTAIKNLIKNVEEVVSYVKGDGETIITFLGDTPPSLNSANAIYTHAQMLDYVKNNQSIWNSAALEELPHKLKYEE